MPIATKQQLSIQTSEAQPGTNKGSPAPSFGWTPYPSRPGSEVKSRHLSLEARVGSSDFDATRNEHAIPAPKELKNNRVIAVDFDEVFTCNMLALCVAHNEQYGTDFTLEDLEYYYLFQNRGWGKPATVQAKLSAMGDLLPQTQPVPSLVPSLRRVRQLGHPIHVVTARSKADEPSVRRWLAEQGIPVGDGPDDLLQGLHFVGSWESIDKAVTDVLGDGAQSHVEKNLEEKGAEVERRLVETYKKGLGAGKGALQKLEVVRKLGAALLVDDHFGNLEPIMRQDGYKPDCLLFGPYRWNKRRSGLSTPVDFMSFEERMAADVKNYGEDVELVDGIERAETWEDVVAWVERWDRLALLKRETPRY